MQKNAEFGAEPVLRPFPIGEFYTNAEFPCMERNSNAEI